MRATGRAFDLKIKGAGFFPLQLPQGKNLYTRIGSFEKNNKGQLQTQGGYLLDCNVLIPAQALQVFVFMGFNV